MKTSLLSYTNHLGIKNNIPFILLTASHNSMSTDFCKWSPISLCISKSLTFKTNLFFLSLCPKWTTFCIYHPSRSLSPHPLYFLSSIPFYCYFSTSLCKNSGPGCSPLISLIQDIETEAKGLIHAGPQIVMASLLKNNMFISTF